MHQQVDCIEHYTVNITLIIRNIIFYSDDNINILMIGAADLGHILLTMANNNLSYKHIHVCT